VEAESRDPNSIFNAYKRLLALRKTNPALRDGQEEDMNENDPDVFAFLRRSGDRTVLVALNMSAREKTVNLQLKGIHGSKLDTLYSSPERTAVAIPIEHVVLAPFGALVAEVK
jgi:alpha-glucosidase